jgi:lipopolysaccharide assembly outer membrane protein LptD (OstA)
LSRAAALVVFLICATGVAPAFAAPTTLEITADLLTADTARQIIEARGRVRISDGRAVVRANAAVYRVKERRISLSGDIQFVTSEGDLTAHQAVAYLTRNRTLESVEASGNVEVESQRRVLNADHVVYTPASRSLSARGNVRVFAPPDMIATGRELFAKQGAVIVLTGSARLQNRDGYLQGDRLEVDEKAETAYLRDNVLGEFRDIKITSDAATLFAKEKKVVFRDRVRIIQPGRTMTADRVTIFYESRRMIAEGTTTIRIEEEQGP